MVFHRPDGGGGLPAGARTGTVRAAGRVRGLILTAGVLAVLLTVCTVCAEMWTDWLWYRSVHYSSVFTTTLRTRIGLFCVFGLLMAAAVGANIALAHRLRPPLGAMSPEQRGLDRYRMGIAPHKKWVLLGVCAAVGLVAGASASAQWRLWLLYANATPFHASDPQFHKDVSFYTFDLPWYRFLLSFGFALVVLCLVAAAAVHYLYGGLRITSPGARSTPAATGHLSVLLGLFVSLKATAYWLDRYGLAVRSGRLRTDGDWTGLRYADAHAVLPGKTTLFCIAVICALLFFAAPRRRDWTLPMVGLGLMGLSAVLVSGLYPAVVQKYQVRSDEAAKEAPYIQRNIDATRKAYGIDGAEVRDYAGTTRGGASSGAADSGTGTGPAAGSGSGSGTGSAAPAPAPAAGPAAPTSAVLRADAGKAASIRLLDPAVVAPALQQAQQAQQARQDPSGQQAKPGSQAAGYYSFPATLDVDRYTVDGSEQDTVVGVRELDSARVPDRDWTSDHVTYTHGYGVVAAAGTSVTADGAPATRDLGPYRAEIYYGERTTQYALVGGPAKAGAQPDAKAGASAPYDGKGGVRLDNPVTRAAYAMAYGQPRFLYSGAIGHGSKILYNRTPRHRVEAVAPWLTVDSDPYPAVVDGHVLWIVDAYTTTDDYPYATRTELGGTTAGTPADGGHPASTRQGQVNYIRNSVKATVDAYDGTVTLYQWDTQDPVLKTWMKAFPHTVRAKSTIPAGLLAHLRYPRDLFGAQRQMLAAYHVTTPAQFAAGGQAWQVPADPASTSGEAMAPSYLSVKMPGQSAKSFSLTSTFAPAHGKGLAALLSVDADAGSPDYGTMRVLRLPDGGAKVDGPRQVQSRFTSDKAFAPALAALKSGGSSVEYGEMLTVPLDGGVLYVEPVYVRRAGTGIPLLRKMLVDFDGTPAFEDTLGKALDTVFAATGGGPGTGTGPGTSPGTTGGPGSAGSPGGTGGPSAAGPSPGGARAAGGGADADLSAALADAQKAYDAGQAAMDKGDRNAYAAAQKRLADALKRARAAARAAAAADVPGGVPTGGPGAGPTAGPGVNSGPGDGQGNGPGDG